MNEIKVWMTKEFREILKDDLGHIEISKCKLGDGTEIYLSEELEEKDINLGDGAAPSLFNSSYYDARIIKLDNNRYQASFEVSNYNITLFDSTYSDNYYTMICIYYTNLFDLSIHPGILITASDTLIDKDKNKNCIPISQGVNIIEFSFPGEILCGIKFSLGSKYLESLESLPDVRINSDSLLVSKGVVESYLKDSSFNGNKEEHTKQYIDKFGFKQW